ncbi:hypothetical protein BDV37DRAFT_277349 [Aspergillus pseudonomiae]|uniref:mRNA stability protein n=1 Tax=Aspergillus pseudonomiae TaxID=1506151 RepID=A0A5N7CRM1_9EURO|nr:uncharacterized protein BDV37DRAFT_277349 [Aspergillus pseudonomiae]KAE8396836.1 hypothetical protein BDV37DRAFT_277349 [Aspergillus pseudonomiae]
MESGRDKKSDSQALSENEKRCLRIYGRLPYRGGLLGQQSKERRYFDSGDLALSAADIVTDNGAIQTGAAHPIRESISRPYAPVPNTSNANKDANRELGGNKSPTPEMIDSPLHQQIDSGKKEM